MKTPAPKVIALHVNGQRLEVEAMNALEVGLYAMRINIQSAVGRAPVRVGTAA